MENKWIVVVNRIWNDWYNCELGEKQHHSGYSFFFLVDFLRCVL